MKNFIRKNVSSILRTGKDGFFEQTVWRQFCKVFGFVVFGLLLLLFSMPPDIFGQSGGGQILFYSNRDGNFEIYKMNSDGANQQRLTNTPENESGGIWSPDGKKILYGKSINSTTSQIWVMNTDGSNQMLISDATGVNTLYGWSPDGQKILYSSGIGQENSGNPRTLWTMSADGTNKVRLTDSTMIDHQAAWSPDGSKIAFGRCDADLICDIYSINSDGSNPVNLTPAHSFDDDAPRWTPDGGKIIYSEQFSESEVRTMIMNADGTGKFVFTDLTGYANLSKPISPDGTKIVLPLLVTQFPSPVTFDIITFGLDGSDFRNLTNNLVRDSFGAWSPDSAKIAFGSRRDMTTTDEIYAMNADGSGVGRLTFNSAADIVTDWRFIAATPAGQNISVAPANSISLTFDNVVTNGFTTANALTLDQISPLPFNFSLTGSSVIYEISTTAVFSGNVVVSFNVPNVASAAACSRLRVLHYTNGDWDLAGNAAPVYNTGNQSCTLSQTVSSLSPFVVAQSNPPANKEQCKNDGWKRFDVPRRFKNQGDCIQFANTGK